MLLISYVVFLHVLLVVILISSDSVRQRLTKGLGWRNPSHVDHYRRMTTFHRRVDASVPEGAVLFIGDSFVQSMCVAAVTERGVNFGIGGDTAEGVLKRLPEYTCLNKVSAVILAVGYNDLSIRDNDAILRIYRDILRLMPNNCLLLICSLLPIDERCRPEQYNNRINELNKVILHLCALNRNCHFVNLFYDLQDKDGNLGREYHIGDGIHLSPEGYRICIEKLRLYLFNLGACN